MKKGFTLIELMVVLAIMGILLIIVLNKLSQIIDKSRETTLTKNVTNIKLAIDQYCINPDGGMDYPTSNTKLANILNESFDNNKVPRTVLRKGANVPALNKSYIAASPDEIPIQGEEGGWVLVTAGRFTGTVFVNSTILDSTGKSYTTYGW